MRVKSWNCTGIASKLNTPKFSRWLLDADVAALQETFLDTSALQISGFSPFIKRAQPAPPGKHHRATGGLVTLVSSQLLSAFRVSSIEGIVFDGFECQFLLFERSNDGRSDLPASFLFLNCYVVSQPATFDFGGLYFALEAMFLAFDLPVVMVGDFNAHWKLPSSKLPSPRDRDFRDFVVHLEDACFSFYPSSPSDLRKPTYVFPKGSSVIDYMFIRGVPSSGFSCDEMTVFGHRALSVTLEWPTAPVTALRERTSHRKHFRRDPPESLVTGFVEGQCLHSGADFLKCGISRVFCLFVLTLGQLFQVSKGHVGSPAEPWHRYLSSKELEPLIRLESEVFSLVAGAQLGEVPLGLTELNLELSRLRRTLHSLATRRLFQNIRGSYGDPTRLWAFVRKFRVRDSQGVLPIDALAAHFTAVFNRVSDPVPMVFCDRNFAVDDPALDEEFTMAELESAFKELDRGTAPGVTGIGNDILLDVFHLPGGPQFFLNLFNACFEGGALPDLWRCTEIFLLYKGKGDVADPNSYRGIALMESSLKLYERLLFNRLSMWARFHGLLPDCQFGFRARSSTLDAVFVFFTLIAKYVLVQGSSLFVCLVDFQKAFPSVNRGQLLVKLESLGVSSRFRRGLNSIFVGNTFAIRHGPYVTAEFPVTTGLREGSVLSPLLFILFMSDIQASVLLPFKRVDFWKRDPQLNGIPVPGLLYADDLVIFCLSADLLRERLKRLCEYADANTMTVNVGKCEVVVFGKNPNAVIFKYKRESIPVRQSCKYLGVWLNHDLSGKALADAVTQKFTAAIPVFFNLCRRLQLARLDLVHRLASSLVFSLLYGCEFLRRTDVVEKCEIAWWRGVRKFYGLPNGVSNVFLKLLFPRVSLIDMVLRAKFNLLVRGSFRSDTIFPEAVICDRGFLLARHRVGFSQSFKEWCEYYRVDEAFEAGTMDEVRRVIATSRAGVRDAEWLQFAGMSSTADAAALFGSPTALFSTVLEASKFGLLGVRASVLAISGALSVSYDKSRFCICGEKFSFLHFLDCSILGPARSCSLHLEIEREDWAGAALIILSRFEVYLHFVRSGALRGEEHDLFSLINDSLASDSDSQAVAQLFSEV
jgi:hypothetical protein